MSVFALQGLGVFVNIPAGSTHFHLLYCRVAFSFILCKENRSDL